MSFLDHLEELRWHIIKALVGLLLATIACGVYADFIVQDILMKPLHEAGLKVQVLAPYGIVLLYMQTVLICGLILSMPNTLFWLWRFVAPGLLIKERRYIGRLVFLTSLCFFAGVAFSYFILLPTSLKFFAVFGTRTIDLNIAADHYVSFILTLLLGAGLVFELPMVSYFLTKIGFLTPAFMRHYRRHSIVAILIISAIVTPTPDPMTQVMLAMPMLLLYEISIFVSKIASKKEETAETERTLTPKEEST
ncbi:MAG: twin-arginine translocase subunit TatC [Ignavibacteriales bacterium]|nr:twin-arginine translocase subunit TatC [Ignavibacteriales bacterium]